MSGELDPERAAALANFVMAEAQGGQISPEDFAALIPGAHFLLKDDDASRIIRDSPFKKKLMLALSTMNRTGRTDDKKSIKEKKLRWRMAVIAADIESEEGMSISEEQSWIVYGDGVIEDRIKGWRGKLLTERIRTYKIESGAGKKGGLFGWIRR